MLADGCAAAASGDLAEGRSSSAVKSLILAQPHQRKLDMGSADNSSEQYKSMAAAAKVLTIVYNADGSLAGKGRYAWQKVVAGGDGCAACALTHGLHLTERKEWTQAKARIHAEVQQVHRDELQPEMRSAIQQQGLQLPCVLCGPQLVLSASELLQISSSPEHFLERLAEKSDSLNLGIRID